MHEKTCAARDTVYDAAYGCWRSERLRRLDGCRSESAWRRARRSKVGADKMASDKLADYGNYNTQLAHREATGGAELHEKFADIFVIQSGEATVIVGGKIDGSHQTAPGEIRGTARHRRRTPSRGDGRRGAYSREYAAPDAGGCWASGDLLCGEGREPIGGLSASEAKLPCR